MSKKYGFYSDYKFEDGLLKDLAVRCGWRRLPTDISYYSVYLSPSGEAVQPRKIGRPKFKKTTIDGGGYRTLKLKKLNGEWITHRMCRLVGEMFCDGYNRPGVYIPHHIDADKTNDSHLNILWCTAKEHRLLHSLINTDKAAYDDLVQVIRELNKQYSRRVFPDDAEAT